MYWEQKRMLKKKTKLVIRILKNIRKRQEKN